MCVFVIDKLIAWRTLARNYSRMENQHAGLPRALRIQFFFCYLYLNKEKIIFSLFTIHPL